MVNLERTLIVGGGIAGLTLASALSQRGFKAELVERNPVWQAVGAGIAVQPNGMRVLRALGMGEAVRKAGTLIRHWGFCDQQQEVLCEIDLQALWGDVGPFIGIERTELHEVLVEGAAAVRHRLGTSLSSLTQQPDSVSVAFSDGSTGDYDLVVGADGISSTVRGLALTNISPADLGAMNWRSIAPIRPHGLGALRFMLGDRCFFGLCPVGDGQTYGFGYVMEPRFRDPLEGRLERLRSRFAGFGSLVQEYLASLKRDDQVHCSAMQWVDVDEWYAGRVVLIGDAAHASSPLMGQGGCMAMEDAYVLAELLHSEDTLDTALRAYVDRRKPRVQWVQQQSMATAESLGLPPATRNTAIRERGHAMMQHRFKPLTAAP
ncbi:MAG TPA: FAD-dependent monooxygenase [Terriglobia bacterium]|nr:FAD-dependent monooxygenase [Terriglobia bacterium]